MPVNFTSTLRITDAVQRGKVCERLTDSFTTLSLITTGPHKRKQATTKANLCLHKCKLLRNKRRFYSIIRHLTVAKLRSGLIITTVI